MQVMAVSQGFDTDQEYQEDDKSYEEMIEM
jgi:hypothetical protein